MLGGWRRHRSACSDKRIGHHATGSFADGWGMKRGGRRCFARAALLAALALACDGGATHAAEAVRKPRSDAVLLPAGAGRGTIETVYFGDRRGPAVRLVRGTAPAAAQPSREIVSFGTGRVEQVTIVRGITAPLTPGAVRQ